MRDGLSWFAAMLVVASVAVAFWCGRVAQQAKVAAVADASASEAPLASQPTWLRGDAPNAASERGASGDVSPGARPCNFGEVVIIAAHSDPQHSSASVRMLSGAMETRRTGESLDGFRVEAIHWDRVRFRRGEVSCDLHIGDDPTQNVEPRDTQERAPKRRRRGMPTWLAEGMKRTGPGSFSIQRSVVDRIVDEAATLIGGTRAKRTENGVRLSRVRGVLKSLGFQAGDVLHNVNGFDLDDPNQLVLAYAKLRTADRVNLSFSRNGKTAELDLSVL